MMEQKHTLPLFNKSILRNDLNSYLDIVTDYTVETKSYIKQMEKASVVKTYNSKPSSQRNNSVEITSPNYFMKQLNQQ